MTVAVTLPRTGLRPVRGPLSPAPGPGKGQQCASSVFPSPHAGSLFHPLEAEAFTMGLSHRALGGREPEKAHVNGRYYYPRKAPVLQAAGPFPHSKIRGRRSKTWVRHTYTYNGANYIICNLFHNGLISNSCNLWMFF